jgi:hypothetical protein
MIGAANGCFGRKRNLELADSSNGRRIRYWQVRGGGFILGNVLK